MDEEGCQTHGCRLNPSQKVIDMRSRNARTGPVPDYEFTDPEKRVVYLLADCLWHAYGHAESVMSEDYVVYPAASDRLDFSYTKENLFAARLLWKLLGSPKNTYSGGFSPAQKQLMKMCPTTFEHGVGGAHRKDFKVIFGELKQLDKTIKERVVRDLIN